ncbi:hypothetical protein D3C77_613760 [compost metagenome]
MPRFADQAQLGLQQARQLARDRQAQSRAALGALQGAIGLAKGLEDQSLLRRLDARPGIGHGKAQMPIAVTLDAQQHRALFGELAGIR